MSDRQDNAATKNQRYRLDRLGIGYANDIDRVQACELLARHQPATQDQRQMLAFFGIEPSPMLSRFEAMDRLSRLMDVPTNKRRWEERLCSPEQLEILRFFMLPVRAELKYRDADRLIEILLRNKRYAMRWDRFETAKFARHTWLSKNIHHVNDLAAYFGCSKLSARVFKDVVITLLRRGMSLREIEGDYDAIFQEALMQQPGLQRVSQSARST